MKLKKCPVCGTSVTKDSLSKKIKWEIRNFRAHIRKMGEREIFLKTLLQDNRKTPHFDYCKKNLVKIETQTLLIKI